MIRTSRGHGVVGVCYSDDPSAERDLGPSEPVGVAGTVPSLVVFSDGASPFAEPFLDGAKVLACLAWVVLDQ